MAGGVRKRGKRPSITKYERVPEESELIDDYGGLVKVHAKKKDPIWITILEILAVILLLGLMYFIYHNEELVHVHTAKFYAHLGNPHAQHVLGHRYLNGSGVDKNHSEAMKWFRKSADQGHAHSAYNLAVGHMQGMPTDVGKGEARKLIKHAMDHGVKEAHHIYYGVCSTGENCDH